MTPNVIITCAVTGAGDTVDKHPAIPVTPEQIANAALEAADAGAAVVHCHVRDPETGKGSRDVALYAEVMERIRAANRDVIINLTAGMGGDLEIGSGENPMDFGAGTDVVGPIERLAHVTELKPEICTLDCGSLNFGDGNGLVVQTPEQLRAQARIIQDAGVKPEMEIFDSGNLWFAKQLVAEGLINDPPMFQICLGIRGVRRAIPRPCIIWQARFPTVPCGPDSASRACRCRWWHRPSCSEDMYASAWKTISISNAASTPQTAH